MQVGDKFTSKTGITVEVVEYNNYMDVLVKRTADGFIFKTQAGHLRKGLVSGVKLQPCLVDVVLPENAVWISGYEQVYAVSTSGDVYSNRGGTLYKMRGGLKGRDGGQYKTVCITSNGTNVLLTVHRVVAETFIPNPDNKPCVNHINGDKLDNRVENLEWCTYSENTQHAYDTGLIAAGVRYSRGIYDERVIESIRRGSLQLDKEVADSIPDDYIAGLGVNLAEFRKLVAPSQRRIAQWPTAELVEMHKTMSMTEISKLTGYSLAAVSRKIRGERK